MAIHNYQNLLTRVAGADLSAQDSRFKAVTVAGTLVAGATGSSNQAEGVLQYGGRAGEHISLCVNGVSKVVAGGAVSTVGFPLAVASGGFFVACPSGGISFGRARETATSGDLFEAMVDFLQAAPWGGV